MDVDDRRRSPLDHPLVGPTVSAFLAGPCGGLIAELDADGLILRASRRLLRRMPPGDRVALADLLTARSARTWPTLLARLAPGGPARRVILRFQGEGPSLRFACLLHREPDGRVWLLAMPGIDAESLAATRQLARELSGLTRHLARSDRMGRVVEKALREARTDPLTGLANRRQGARWFREAIIRHRQDAAPLCCVVIDIDHFKAINDTFGHPVGDRVLQVAARVLSEQIRPRDRIFRYGGEEFVVLLPETDLDTARSIADRLRVALAQSPIRPLGDSLHASFGVACLRAGESASALFKRADQALVQAKQLGRDRVEVAP